MSSSYIVVDWGVISGPPQPQYLTADAYTSANASVKKGNLTVQGPIKPMPSEYGWFNFGSSLATGVQIPSTISPAFIDVYIPKLFKDAPMPQLLLTSGPGTTPLVCMNSAALPKDDTNRFALKVLRNDALQVTGTTDGFTYIRLGVTAQTPDALTLSCLFPCIQAVAVYATNGSKPPVFPALNPVFGMTITANIINNKTILTATVKPASTIQGVTWTSLNPDVAAINSKTGTVSVTQGGTATFQAVTQASDMVSGTISLYIKPAAKKNKGDVIGMWVGIGLAIATVVTAVVVAIVYSVKHRTQTSFPLPSSTA